MLGTIRTVEKEQMKTRPIQRTIRVVDKRTYKEGEHSENDKSNERKNN